MVLKTMPAIEAMLLSIEAMLLCSMFDASMLPFSWPYDAILMFRLQI